MMGSLLLSLSLLLLLVFCGFVSNAEIEWKKIDDALPLSKSSGSPILILSVRKGCKPCKKLIEQMEVSPEFSEQSKKYILVKVEDAEIAKLGPYKGKGKYVPKVTFVNSNGIFISELDNKNKKNEKTKYFYKKVEDVVESMVVGLEHQYMDSGFGKDYVWYDWEGGLAAAKEQKKPILVIFHQEWCGACKRLKPIFSKSEEVKGLASKFIMINTDTEEVVTGENYKADGEYYPKILFLDSEGRLYDEEINYGTKHKHVLHYYGNGAEIRRSMERVLGNITEMENVPDNGFGKHIKWVKYQKALELVKELKKPMMLIISKSYCGACKAMKPKIRNDKEIAELSKQFVMVNVDDDEEPDDDQFDQDGAYIPRIFFLDNNGKVETSIFNEGKSYKKSRFAYGSPKQIVTVMKKALEMKLGERGIEEVRQQEEAKETKTEKTKTTEQKTTTPSIETTEPVESNDGFGTNIKWYTYKEGVTEAKKSHKIGLVFFYNNYCMFSKFMKDQFNDSPQVTELSEKFIMIKVSEDEAKTLDLKDKYDIDGTYTPRMFFIDPDQNVYIDINNTNTHYDKTLYYYGTAGEIVESMKLAIEKINVTLGRGFGEYIEWVKYEKGLELIKEKNIPMMLIIHKTWCGACSALKPKIRESRAIWELSKYFIMSNVEDSEEPIDNDFFIDGGYYPRIYFLDSTGKVHHDLHNRDPAFLKYKYSYAYEDQILHTMKFAIGKFYTSQEQQIKQDKEVKEVERTETEEKSTNSVDSKKEKMLSPGKRLLANMGVKWNTIDVALKQAAESKKPIMFLIHRTTCPACKATIKLFSRDNEFKNKSTPLILADIEDDVDDELADSYDVDGTYVPRIYFLDPEGKIFRDIWNVGTNYLENKFYFFEVTSVHRAMEKALKKMETWVPGSNKEPNKTPPKTEEKKEEESETKNEEVRKETKDEL